MKILIASALLLGTTLIIRGVDPVAVIGGCVLVLFLAYVFRNKPKKHKDFTYSDQLKGMLQSYGGNPPPEVGPPDELNEEQPQKPPNKAL